MLRSLALVLALSGIALIIGGGYLISLGGTPYYLLCGCGLCVSGALVWCRRVQGALTYGLILLLTLAWSLWEVGPDGWALMPRLLGPSLLGLVFFLPAMRKVLGSNKALWFMPGMLSVAVLVLILAALQQKVASSGQDPRSGERHLAVNIAGRAADANGGDGSVQWTHFGGNLAGTRFSTLTEITPGNVDELQPVWKYDIPNELRGEKISMQATPIQIGNTLYLCGRGLALALDAETGRRRWQADLPLIRPGDRFARCRGVAYYASNVEIPDCTHRIFLGTMDVRLLALDAASGKPCKNFGDHGVVDLLVDMGRVEPGVVAASSPPLIVGRTVVVGSSVLDGVEVNEAPGVVRAYDAITGEFRWAFDPGRPHEQTRPAAGESYEPGTPNAWTVFSADEQSGLLYISTGNATPDFWGAHRSAQAEKYSSSVIALDIHTGAVKWHFQTVHHDLWDYDVGSQPVLFDYRSEDGGIVPALIQPTKRGVVFVLNRLTGEPVDSVEERRVPQGAASGDYLSPTQPYPRKMPSFSGPDLREADMWGLTPLDQLWCRIEFQKLRYEGQFTPPSVIGSLHYPGHGGGMNVGSVSIDPEKRLLVVLSLRMAFRVSLIPREQAQGIDSVTIRPHGNMITALQFPQRGTPFAAISAPFLSPLQVPCQRPPYGVMSVVDLDTFSVVWERPIGTAAAAGPLGIKSRLPILLGAPFYRGGTAITRSGLVFFGASNDDRIRAVDILSGRELWSDAIEGGANSHPIIYTAPASRREFVVIAGRERVIAYALPKTRNF